MRAYLELFAGLAFAAVLLARLEVRQGLGDVEGGLGQPTDLRLAQGGRQLQW